jgi:hypothetical protein
MSVIARQCQCLVYLQASRITRHLFQGESPKELRMRIEIDLENLGTEADRRLVQMNLRPNFYVTFFQNTGI